MSQPKLSDLAKLIKSDNPKVRRKAFRQLALSRDPRVIPYLRNAYLSDDDDKVRDITYEGLAAFKAIQLGRTSRHLPISDNLLKKVLAGLAILFVISLLLNGASLLLGGESEDGSSTTAPEQLTPTPRNMLVSLLRDRITETGAFSTAIRSEINLYNTSGSVSCDLALALPQAILMSELDKATYRDLAIVSNRLDATLATTNMAQFRWRHSCNLPAPDVYDVIDASALLDQVDSQLAEIDALLANAIENPAPTTAPTFTAAPPLPDATQTPASVPTTQEPDAAPTSEPVQPTTPPSPTSTLTLTPTFTNTPAATLPYPDLDYPTLLSDLSRQFAVLGDLQNRYETGMVNRWRQAQSTAGPSNASGCVLDTWPSAFTLTAEQQAQLARTDAVDPQLSQAILLVQEGMSAAVQARALFERDCPTGALASSAAEGIPLAEGAYNRLSSARDIVNTIRQRPDTP